MLKLSANPGWMLCRCRFPGCASHTLFFFGMHGMHFALKKLPLDSFKQTGLASERSAASPQQVSASVGSSLTLSQNSLLCQGCSLVHILGSVYQQDSWLAP